MVLNKLGKIFNVSSEAEFPELPVYIASKHEVIGLTEATAIGHAIYGININTVRQVQY